MTVDKTLHDTYRALRSRAKRAWITCVGWSDTQTAAKVLQYARQRIAEGHPESWYGEDSAQVGGTYKIGSDTVRYFPKPEAVGLRKVGYADELVPRGIEHTGWYADTIQNDLYRGVVYRLPGKDGRTRMLAGYESSDTGETVLTAGIDDWIDTRREEPDSWDYRTVARSADQIAQRAAESAREHDQAWQAGSRWAENRDDMHKLRRERHKYQAAQRDHRPGSTVYDGLQLLIDQANEASRELHDENVKLQEGEWFRDGYDLTFSTRDASLIGAFCDGANLKLEEFPR